MPNVGAYVASYKSSGAVPWDAQIRCFATETIPPGPENAFIRFFKNAADVPADSHVNGVPTINYSFDQFTVVLDLLRGSDRVTVDTVGTPGVFGVHVGIHRVGTAT